MARKPRIDLGNYVYHIITRGNNKQATFLEPLDYNRYLKNLEKAKEKFPFLLYLYALMNNHAHLLIKPLKGGVVSKIMQSINTGYAMYFNRKYHRNGHLFQGRFQSIVVEEESHLLELSRYVHLNPVRAGLTQRCEDYPYSSYLTYIEEPQKEVNLVDREDILSRFGREEKTQFKRYKAFVEERRQRKIYNPYATLREGRFLGSEEFKNKILK